MAVTEGLNPQRVFYYFEEICNIPHGSGNIDAVSDYLKRFADERELFCIQDELKNIIIVKEASEGYETQPPIILQGHMDMVTVKKAGASIDMKKEGLRLRIDGDSLYAQDTSLGGDDGIAVAYSLAILEDDSLAHPKLEVVITVDEETGMDGAREIDVSMLEGRRMLNLDSEEEGIILAGCAGGARVDWKLPVRWKRKEGNAFQVEIKGLTGGHSGSEIDKERGNANCLLGRVLAQLEDLKGFSVAEAEGGLADNAIPREAGAKVLIAPDEKSKLLEAAAKLETQIKQELQTKEAGFYIEIKNLGEESTDCLEEEDKKSLIDLLCCAPNGVLAMSADIKGLVETSLNMGIIRLNEKEFTLQFSVRSSVESAKQAVIKKMKRIADLTGAIQEVRGEYPGWRYQKDSPFRDMAVRVYLNMFGKEPEIQAIHAGLECGLLSAKLEGLECISIGPDMKDIHTTEERLSIASTERVWNYILEILKQK